MTDEHAIVRRPSRPRQPSHRRRWFAGLLAAVLASAGTHGAYAIDFTSGSDQPLPAPVCPPGPEPAPLTVEPPAQAGTTVATGDRARREGAITTLRGDAEVVQSERSVQGQFIELDRADDSALVRDQIFLTTEQLLIEAERGTLALDSGAFRVDRARYHQRTIGAQGVARRIEDDGEQHTRLETASFSTCPRQGEDWYLTASSIDLNRDSRQGTARDVSLRFFGVPLFYTPWLRFPLGSERMTGFLAPTFGTSTNSGTEISIPWYWNAAPNFDATLTPVFLERRGGQLRSRWRWLNRQGSWELENEYLPDDRQFGDDRSLTRIEHEGRLGRSWSTSIEAADASDEEYFDDFGNDLDVAGQTHLRREAEIGWRGRKSEFTVSAQSFQTVDRDIPEASRPFKQLPKAEFIGEDYDAGPFAFDIDVEAIQWERDERTTGSRVRVVPALRAPIERPGWFVRPRLALDYTQYELDRVAGDPGRSSIDRSLPVTSLDTGLRFDRPAGRFRQTLEPRLFYVHIPSEQQQDIPLFDTAEFDFSFGQLFRERRFTGGDRIGDSNRLTVALTSRLLERDDGREFLRASIGGLRHFSDREVRLGTDEPDTRDTSDVVGELAFSPSERWNAQATAQWDPENDQTTRQSVRLQYVGKHGGVVNLGWRQRYENTATDGDTVEFEKQQDQIDTSFAWPINHRWRLFGRLLHSPTTDRNLDTLAGVEYSSCCWSVRALARERIDDFDPATDQFEDSLDRSFSIQLVLHGLGGIGDEAGDVFERAILGYETADQRSLNTPINP